MYGTKFGDIEKVATPVRVRDWYDNFLYYPFVYEPSTSIYGENDPAECVFRIVSGIVALMRSSINHRGKLVTSCSYVCGPGDSFGALFGERVYLDTAVVLIETKAQASDPNEMPQDILLAEVLRQHRNFRETVTIANDGPPRLRVARMLALLYRKYYRHYDGFIELPHRVIGALVSTSRESASRILHELADDYGYIDVNRTGITVHDPEMLEKFAIHELD